jgi:UDP-glucuronate decarboxylase
MNAILALMETPDEFTGPVNIGNPAEMTIKQLAEKIVQLTASRSEIVFKALPHDDPRQREPDISLARQALNWNPKISLEDGLLKTIDYFERLLKTR